MKKKLRDITIIKIQVLNKLLQLIGNKNDIAYDSLFNLTMKKFKFSKIYTHSRGFIKFNKFNDFDDFLDKVKSYHYIDGISFMNEVANLLDNINILPEKKQKETKTIVKKTPVITIITETKQKETKTKKKPISATMKKLVWNTNIGEEIGKSKCLCCKSTDITQLSFNSGHIIAEANGGDTIVSNLKPICQNCNSSMGTKNMNDFMKTLL